MDAADRIPIDIGYDTSAPALLAEPRTTLREDGTIVIDTTPPQPCATEPSTEEEIVVCAALEEPVLGHAAPPPPQPTLMDKLSAALRTRIGPVELGSIPQGDGTYALGLRIRF